MTDSLLKAAMRVINGGLRCILPHRRIVPAPKMAHYIGGVKLGIARARVVSIILAVEGYVCALQSTRIDDDSTATHPEDGGSTLGNRANGVRRDAAARWRAVTSRSNGFARKQ
ncbi:hypothetical protein AAGS40_08065 [Paraburkholderia sp. PREW-6R]|uniref:hypothetical protein n=1 Tax=Paraburkholderia sp. PREW-6R TaxID=3141544 RepID=UPI0031F5D1BA